LSVLKHNKTVKQSLSKTGTFSLLLPACKKHKIIFSDANIEPIFEIFASTWREFSCQPRSVCSWLESSQTEPPERVLFAWVVTASRKTGRKGSALSSFSDLTELDQGSKLSQLERA